MDASFALGMELSSTTNGATSYVREAVESILGLELGDDGDEGAHRLHS